MRNLFLVLLAAALVLAAPPAHADDRGVELGPRRDPTMFTAGVVTTVGGGAAVLAGATFLMVGSGFTIFRCTDLTPCPHGDAGLEWAGGVLAAVGVVALAVGVPMIALGGKRSRALAAIAPFPLPGGAGVSLAAQW